MLVPILLLALHLCLVSVLAQQQVRVDDNDSAITYNPAGSWHRSTTVSNLDAGGHHMVTTDEGATATFTFTGTGVAFMAPLWADTVTTLATLDNGPSVLIDMTDPTQTPETDGPSTVASAILWSSLNLNDGLHTLVLSVPPGGQYAIVDMLIYYVPGDSSSTTSASPTTTTSDTTSTTSPNTAAETGVVTPSTRRGLSIALGIVCSAVGILIILSAFLFWRRRQRKRQEQALWQQSEAAPIPPPPALMGEVNDGITAGHGRRYKSIPTLKKLAAASGSDLTSSYEGEHQSMTNGAAPRVNGGVVGKQGQGSKLRNVVASQEPTGRLNHTRTSSDGRLAPRLSGGASPTRKFTLSPTDSSNTQFRT